MISKALDKLNRLSPWHFVWISIVASELITLLLSTVQGRIWWGTVSRETLITGAVDALVVPLIVASVVIYFVRQTAELQRANERLEEANRKLQALDKLKSDLVSVVSHEFRTPLTTIKAFVEVLVMKPGMPEPPVRWRGGSARCTSGTSSGAPLRAWGRSSRARDSA